MARTGRPPKRFDTEAWKEGFSEYTKSYEVRLKRRLDTYGGQLWPHKAVSGIIPQARQMEIALQALERTA